MKPIDMITSGLKDENCRHCLENYVQKTEGINYRCLFAPPGHKLLIFLEPCTLADLEKCPRRWQK